MVLSISFNFDAHLISHLASHQASMKLLTIFIVMCRLVYQNNSNYIPFFIAIYLNLASAKVDAIILLNYVKLFVLYNLLLQKLKDIKAHNIVFIKQ